MRVDDANVALYSKHSYMEQYSREESLRVWAGGEDPGTGIQDDAAATASLEDVVQLSDQAKTLGASKPGVSVDGSEEGSLELSIGPQDNMKLEIIRRLLEVLTGKKFRFLTMDDINRSGSGSSAQAVNSRTAAVTPQPQRQGWGLRYDATETYTEQEKMTFAAEGVIRTRDGREIRFSVRLSLSREFIQTQSFSLRAGDAAKIDPLVINFDGNAAELTDTKFSFDLNSDGKPEQISFVRPGSGFLALDRDNDGKIDNGTELFGPAAGNGFAELAILDSDGNGWIDEGDQAYSSLLIWSKDAQGNDCLSTLGEKGIGAIFLGSVETSFEFKDKGNVLQGKARRAGIYVAENGSAGTIQQIDLAL